MARNRKPKNVQSKLEQVEEGEERTVAVRITMNEHEDRVFVRAAEVLEISVSDLVRVAALEACHRMGLSNPRHVPSHVRAFEHAPWRESTLTRAHTIRLNRFLELLFHKAAELSGPLALAHFLVGAVLVFVARHGRYDKGLGAIKLPEQYRDRF